MITPSYAPTATERVLPRMALDFTTGILDPRVTVTRALNTATRTNNSGFIESVDANLPRFDYNPVTLAAKGLLIEEARTNLLLQSSGFNETSWVKTSVNVGADVEISPDGTQNAETLSSTTAISNAVYQNVTLALSTSYSFSVFMKAGTSARQRLLLLNLSPIAEIANALVNWTDGVPTITGASPSFTSLTLFDVGNGWYRVSGSFTTTAASTTYRMYIYPDYLAGTGSVYAWGAQLETGAFATSYIPTTTTSLTRNADNVSMTGTNFSDWFTSNGSMVNRAMIMAKNVTTHNCCHSLVGSGIYIDFRLNDRFSGSSRISGTNSLLLQPSGVPAINTPQTLSFGLEDGVTSLASFNGSVPVTDSAITLFGAATSLRLGAGNVGSDVLNGWLQKFNFYPQKLTDNEIRAFSK